MPQLQIGTVTCGLSLSNMGHSRVLGAITHGQDPTIWLLQNGDDASLVDAISSSLMETKYGAGMARQRLYNEARKYVDKWNELDRDY